MSENPNSPDPLEAAIVALTARIDSMAGEIALISSSPTFSQTKPPDPCFARGDSTITPPPLKPLASDLFTGSNGMHPNERFPRLEGAAAVDSPEEVEDAAEQNPTYTGSVTMTKSSHEVDGLADPVTNPMAETILNLVSVVAQPAIRQKRISPMLPPSRHYNRLLFPSAKFQDASLSLEQQWSSHDPYAPQSRDNVSFPGAFPAVSHLSTRSRPAPSDQKRVSTDQSRPFTVGSIRVLSASTNQRAARFPPCVKKNFVAFDRSANAMDQLVRGSRSMGFIKNLGLDTGWAKLMHDVFFKQWDPGKFILWANFYNLEDKVGLHGVWNVRITESGPNATTDPNTTTTSAHPRRIIQQPTYLQGFVWKPRMTKVLEYHSSSLFPLLPQLSLL